MRDALVLFVVIFAFFGVLEALPQFGYGGLGGGYGQYGGFPQYGYGGGPGYGGYGGYPSYGGYGGGIASAQSSAQANAGSFGR